MGRSAPATVLRRERRSSVCRRSSRHVPIRRDPASPRPRARAFEPAPDRFGAGDRPPPRRHQRRPPCHGRGSSLTRRLHVYRAKRTLDTAGRWLLKNAERHLKPAAEMQALFRDLPKRWPTRAGSPSAVSSPWPTLTIAFRLSPYHPVRLQSATYVCSPRRGAARYGTLTPEFVPSSSTSSRWSSGSTSPVTS